MEQPSESAAPMAASKQKNGGGLKAFAAIASIVALAGIGFGVYGMIQANNASEKNKDLKIQVTNADGTVSTIEADKIEVKDGDNVAVVTEPVKTENADRYIYVSNWGLKIKLDDNMEFATYIYNYDRSDLYSVIYVSGAPKNNQIVPSYTDLNNCKLGLGAVSSVGVDRYEVDKANYKEGDAYIREPFMTRDGYAYFYSHPQAICSDDKDGEVKMASYIENMLSNPENYSAI